MLTRWRLTRPLYPAVDLKCCNGVKHLGYDDDYGMPGSTHLRSKITQHLSATQILQVMGSG
jgi:hypothetical protein